MCVPFGKQPLIARYEERGRVSANVLAQTNAEGQSALSLGISNHLNFTKTTILECHKLVFNYLTKEKQYVDAGPRPD